MTYESFEKSVEGGRPIELYKFTVGSTVYRYTSAEDTVTPVFDPTAYFSRQIARNNPSQANDDRREPLELTLPTDDELAARFIDIPPGPEVLLEITRFHRGDTNAYIIWQGKITGVAYTENGSVCQFTGVTDESAFQRPIPRFKYQGLCNHVLYDTLCKVNRASFQYTGTVAAVLDNTVTVTGVSANGADWAVGGYIDFDSNDYRMVIDQSGDVLTVLIPFESSPLGASVDVYAGCDHTITTCQAKFTNKDNFGGFPYVPTFNPFDRGL